MGTDGTKIAPTRYLRPLVDVMWKHLIRSVTLWLDGCVTGVSAPDVVEEFCTLFHSPTELRPGTGATNGWERDYLLTTIISSERLSETNRIHKIVRSFKGNLSFLVPLSRAPTSSSIGMDSSSDNPTRWVTEFSSPTFHWNIILVLFKSFVTQYGPCDWRTYHSVCSGIMHTLPGSPNFVARQATWFC